MGSDTPVKRVLIVDDDASVLRVTTQMLQSVADRLGIPVEIQGTGDPIHVLYDLVYQQREDFDLVLLDIRMPKVCGEEIFRSMQLMDSALQERVVFITAYPDDLREAVFGVKLKVIRKPFRLQQVEDMCVKLFGLEDRFGEREAPWIEMENPPH